MQKRLDRHRTYNRYMEKVLEAAEDFHEIREIIARHDTLTATHEDLVDAQISNQDVVETQRQELIKYSEVPRIFS